MIHPPWTSTCFCKISKLRYFLPVNLTSYICVWAYGMNETPTRSAWWFCYNYVYPIGAIVPNRSRKLLPCTVKASNAFCLDFSYVHIQLCFSNILFWRSIINGRDTNWIIRTWSCIANVLYMTVIGMSCFGSLIVLNSRTCVGMFTILDFRRFFQRCIHSIKEPEIDPL